MDVIQVSRTFKCLLSASSTVKMSTFYKQSIVFLVHLVTRAFQINKKSARRRQAIV